MHTNINDMHIHFYISKVELSILLCIILDLSLHFNKK